MASGLQELPPADGGVELGPGRQRLREVACRLPRPDAGPTLASDSPAAEVPRPEGRLPAGPDCSCGRCAAKRAGGAFRLLQAELDAHEDPGAYCCLAMRSVLIQDGRTGKGAKKDKC